MAGVDAIVASGFEAGGHRVAFLRAAEDSLAGRSRSSPAAVDAVRAPVIAAGGIADARGVAAALALGAEAVQIGTAFLATDESGTTPEHRAALARRRARRTTLTRAFTGRLARGSRTGSLVELTEVQSPTRTRAISSGRRSPRPAQQGRTDVVALWAGQATSLLRDCWAADLYASLVDGTGSILAAVARESKFVALSPTKLTLACPNRSSGCDVLS